MQFGQATIEQFQVRRIEFIGNRIYREGNGEETRTNEIETFSAKKKAKFKSGPR